VGTFCWPIAGSIAALDQRRVPARDHGFPRSDTYMLFLEGVNYEYSAELLPFAYF